MQQATQLQLRHTHTQHYYTPWHRKPETDLNGMPLNGSKQRHALYVGNRLVTQCRAHGHTAQQERRIVVKTDCIPFLMLHTVTQYKF